MIPPWLLAWPWIKVAKVGVIVLGIVLVVSTVWAGYRYVGDLTEQAISAEVGSRIAIDSLRRARAAIEAQNAAVLEASRQRDEAVAAWEEALARPPRVIWRERPPDENVNEVIAGPDCDSVVIQAWDYLQGLRHE